MKLIIILVTVLSMTKALSECGCPRNFSPVCASDGVTYPNVCLMECRMVGKRANMV